MENKPAPRFPLPVRIVAIVLAILVTGGVLTYLAWFLISLFA